MSSFQRYKQRYYAAFVFLGMGILLTRTLIMIFQGMMEILVQWVAATIIIELIIDVGSMMAAIPWFISNARAKSTWSLRLCATAIIFHFIRVVIFILGRVGPWVDFDLRPEHRTLHQESWDWSGVYLAGTLSTLSVIGLILGWRWWNRTGKAAQ